MTLLSDTEKGYVVYFKLKLNLDVLEIFLTNHHCKAVPITAPNPCLAISISDLAGVEGGEVTKSGNSPSSTTLLYFLISTESPGQAYP